MIFADFKDFVAELPPSGRLLGIDWGARRIGIAVSDDARGFVFPREVLPNADKIIEIIKSEKIIGIVIGLPLYVDGTDSDTTRQVRDFAARLATATDLPIAFVDEQLSSIEAYERHPNARHLLDAHAAVIILEDAIGKIKRTVQ